MQRDLLDALLRAKRSAENNNTAEISAESVGLSDDHLLMTVGDIFGAGVETTTTVLKWAITYLIHYPQVRGRHRGLEYQWSVWLGALSTVDKLIIKRN